MPGQVFADGLYPALHACVNGLARHAGGIGDFALAFRFEKVGDDYVAEFVVQRGDGLVYVGEGVVEFDLDAVGLECVVVLFALAAADFAADVVLRTIDGGRV
jgi:hypothetical protein